ncbi:hypothetical protein ACNKHV_25740 [Shigella flexneri]
MGQGADDFLGTQGDQRTRNPSMFCAPLGALTTVIFLAALIVASYGALA